MSGGRREAVTEMDAGTLVRCHELSNEKADGREDVRVKTGSSGFTIRNSRVGYCSIDNRCLRQRRIHRACGT